MDGATTTARRDIEEPGGLDETVCVEIITPLLTVVLTALVMIIIARLSLMATKTALTVLILTSMQTTTALHGERTSSGKILVNSTATCNL